MVNIPKKVSDRFIKVVPQFQKIIVNAKNRDINESNTVSIIQDIFSEVFGYDRYTEITSEFAIRGTYCDLALKINNKVQFLIEVKAVGIDLKGNHLRQAAHYGVDHDTQWIILTNGIEWMIYRIRFERPINYELVCSFDLSIINPKDEKIQECLFLVSREGLTKKFRDEYFEKVQSINRFVIGRLILSESVLSILRRELKKFADGRKIDLVDVEEIVKTEVLKRELIEGEEAKAAQIRVNKFYRKMIHQPKQVTVSSSV